MSGRLVILRHKSWNVWNQDNVEKVLRDERLHRETIEEESTNQRSSSQRKNWQSLGIEDDVADQSPATKPTVSNSELTFSQVARTKSFDNRPRSKLNEESFVQIKLEDDPMVKFVGKRSYEEFAINEAKLSEPELSKSSYFSSLEGAKEPNDSKRKTTEPKPKSSALADKLEELRKRRLLREIEERKKASKLLAQVDIVGSNYSVEDRDIRRKRR
jgi:hypothetical protein